MYKHLKQRRKMKGVVVSTKMAKTVVVLVTRTLSHPRYKKVVRMDKKCYAHCEIEGVRDGDTVSIVGCRPLSKMKRWFVLEVCRAGEVG